MKDDPQPTENELELLACLWETGGGTIAEVRRAFDKDVAYPTVQIRLNRLVDKGWASKTDDRPARYTAAVKPRDVSRGRLQSLLDKVTDGRVAPLVAELVGRTRLSEEEITEIRRLIDAAEAKQAKTARKKPKRGNR